MRTLFAGLWWPQNPGYLVEDGYVLNLEWQPLCASRLLKVFPDLLVSETAHRILPNKRVMRLALDVRLQS